MTGRRLGYCTGYNEPGYANPSFGRGLGRSWRRGLGLGYRGRGRGFWGREYYPEPYTPRSPSVEEEKTYLENIVKDLEEEIKSIKERLQELSKEKKDNS
jgi:hypothetical protein